MTISLYNNLAILMYTQTLNNLPVKRYGAIFRHVREDFIDITTRARMRRKTHCMGLNLKYWFCQSIKRKIKKQIPLFGGIKLMHYSFFMHNKSPWRQGVNNLSYTKYAPIITITKKISFFIIHLPNLILHAVFTQPEKDSLSFFTCWLICSNKSSSKRICFIVLFERSKSFFSFFTCTGSYHCDKLGCKGSYHYISNYLKKTIPRSATNTIEGSNQTIKQEVMIMANRYDSAPLRAEQSKLFKFYDLSIIDKNRLHEFQNLGYINLALAKSSVRIGTLFILLATHDALSVFFCVNACAHLFIKSFSMVALVGQPKGWLVSSRASSSNPANVTANEIGTSSGDYLNNYLLEAVIMTTTPNPIVSTQKLFKFYDLSTAQVIQTTATTEREARKSLGKQSLIFIARIRLTPIIERARTWGGYSHE